LENFKSEKNDRDVTLHEPFGSLIDVATIINRSIG